MNREIFLGSGDSDSTITMTDARISNERQFLPERTGLQIDSFIDLLEGYNDKLPLERRRTPEDYAYLRNFFPAFVADRNKRAAEVKSDEYREIVAQVKENLPLATLAVMCMDGRVKMIHAFGFSADIGSAKRQPGGILKEYYRDEAGSMRLDPDSKFAAQLDTVLRKNEFVAEVFDSHYGCAARESEEKARGRKLKDGGLFSDVLHKREMVRATREYVQVVHPDSDKLSLIQTTFNPKTGYMYMGLETDRSLEFAQEHAKHKSKRSRGMVANPVYSKEVLEKLIDQGLIISTGKLIEDPEIRQAFDANYFQISWKDNYVDSAKNFWNGIFSMREKVLPIIKAHLERIYPQLSERGELAERELEERAILLLSNAFNAYLHNPEHVESDYLRMSDKDYGEKKQYVFDTHREEGVKISRGGHPVYDIAMLVIDSEDDVAGLPVDVEFGGGIVRENRELGRIIDRFGVYESVEDFVAGPVPVVMQEIITDDRLSEKDWEALNEIDWSWIKDINWDSMTSAQFLDLLQEKALLQNSIANAVDNLRINMATIFNPKSVSAAHLVDQYKVALPIICGPDRETHAVIPFVKLGY